MTPGACSPPSRLSARTPNLLASPAPFAACLLLPRHSQVLGRELLPHSALLALSVTDAAITSKHHDVWWALRGLGLVRRHHPAAHEHSIPRTLMSASGTRVDGRRRLVRMMRTGRSRHTTAACLHDADEHTACGVGRRRDPVLSPSCESAWIDLEVGVGVQWRGAPPRPQSSLPQRMATYRHGAAETDCRTAH